MSNIQWTDETWNPTVGCTRVSPGCEHCYAERVAHRGMQAAHQGLTVAGSKGPRWNGVVRTLPERLEQPLRWRKPRRVFVDSMSDLFHEDVPFEFIDRVFATMALTTKHTYQVLTKRPERMLEYMLRGPDAMWRMVYPGGCGLWPLPNVFLGVSVENQAAADERIPLLLQTPAAVRFLSVEPLLEAVDLDGDEGEWLNVHPVLANDRLGYAQKHDGGRRCSECEDQPTLDWVIVGGESGPGARPCNVEWVRGVVRQCDEAGVPVFVKQLGSSWRRSEIWTLGGDSKGGDPSEWPENLRRREFPA